MSSSFMTRKARVGLRIPNHSVAGARQRVRAALRALLPPGNADAKRTPPTDLSGPKDGDDREQWIRSHGSWPKTKELIKDDQGLLFQKSCAINVLQP